jgi:hypothetical protein
MERVETLIEKLQEQMSRQSPVHELLATVQMIQSELQHIQQMQPEVTRGTVALDIPIAPIEKSVVTFVEDESDKVVMELDLNEEEVEAEIKKIKADADARMVVGVKNRPAFLFDPMEEIPTLAHQHTVKTMDAGTDQPSQKDSLNEAMADTPIKDLKKAIGINDRFLFIGELFNGDEVAFDRSIKTINNYGAFAEAELWMRRELIHTYGWDDKSPVVKQFFQLVRRRFS